MVDGFDVAAAGYVAPVLRREWTLDATQLGVLFGLGLLGVTLGSFLWGPVADAIGRKRVILISLLIFGGASLASAASPSFTVLTVLRLLTGFGVGGALPNAITLSSEHSVSRHRSLLVTMMISGFPLGLAFGGGFAAWLMPRFGWQSVFVLGGVVPLLLAPIAWKWLPESLQFMASKARFAEEPKATLHRLGSAETTLPVEASTANKAPAAALFDIQYRRGMVLLWTAFFCNLWVYYQVTSWLPTVIADSGITPGHAAGIGSLLPVSGIVGSFFMARLMDQESVRYPGMFLCGCSGVHRDGRPVDWQLVVATSRGVLQRRDARRRPTVHQRAHCELLRQPDARDWRGLGARIRAHRLHYRCRIWRDDSRLAAFAPTRVRFLRNTDARSQPGDGSNDAQPDSAHSAIDDTRRDTGYADSELSG